MKIAYIGLRSDLERAVVERLEQEGNDVYLLATDLHAKAARKLGAAHAYRIPHNAEQFEKLLRSISPDCVIFAGDHYMGGQHEMEFRHDLELLTDALRAVAEIPKEKFILLSSTEVYGDTSGKVDEKTPRAPQSDRGLFSARAEDLVNLYRERYNLDAVILRVSQLYTDHPAEGEHDLLSRSFAAAGETDTQVAATTYQPLHVTDLADAIQRIIKDGSQPVYNVTGSQELDAKHLFKLIGQQSEAPAPSVKWVKPDAVALADSSTLKNELGWTASHSLEDDLKSDDGISYDAQKSDQDKRKSKHHVPTALRQLIENLLIFGVFFALDYICRPDPIFSQVNWLLIYVILVSVAYNPYQSLLASILASVAYLFGRNLGLPEMATFYDYAPSIFAVLEFVFLGLIVSYTTNMLREQVRNATEETRMVREDYEDLKAINDENVLIKNEYEDRILTSKTGFPKLYDMISRLNVQEPESVLVEMMQIISELMGTKTVAVYEGKTDRPWLRLVGALSKDSTMGGTTWNLTNSPTIREAVSKGELYRGAMGTDEPAVVLPVALDGIDAVVLIRKLPFASNTLYHENLLKTLSLLLRDSMQNAIEHERLSRQEHYIEDTNILKPEAFKQRVRIAQEDAEKGFEEYCIVELTSSDPIEKRAKVVEDAIRITDHLGTDEKGNLLALLNNTTPDEFTYLQDRLAKLGIKATIVPKATQK